MSKENQIYLKRLLTNIGTIDMFYFPKLVVFCIKYFLMLLFAILVVFLEEVCILAPDFLCINILSLHPLRLTLNVGCSYSPAELSCSYYINMRLSLLE